MTLDSLFLSFSIFSLGFESSFSTTKKKKVTLYAHPTFFWAHFVTIYIEIVVGIMSEKEFHKKKLKLKFKKEKEKKKNEKEKSTYQKKVHYVYLHWGIYIVDELYLALTNHMLP